jgi:hypothetical protein
MIVCRYYRHGRQFDFESANLIATLKRLARGEATGNLSPISIKYNGRIVEGRRLSRLLTFIRIRYDL